MSKAFLLLALSIFVLGVVDIAYEGFHRFVLGKSSYSNEAVFKVPDSTLEIVLERRAIHLFLAEYERTLVLRVGGKERVRIEAAGDTGGYCRMNVYQIDPTKYFLAGDLSFDKYFLNVEPLAFTQDVLAAKPSSARFLGAFDRDERGWRFIPAYERPEQKSTLITVDAHVAHATESGHITTFRNKSMLRASNKQNDRELRSKCRVLS